MVCCVWTDRGAPSFRSQPDIRTAGLANAVALPSPGNTIIAPTAWFRVHSTGPYSVTLAW